MPLSLDYYFRSGLLRSLHDHWMRCRFFFSTRRVYEIAGFFIFVFLIEFLVKTWLYQNYGPKSFSSSPLGTVTLLSLLFYLSWNHWNRDKLIVPANVEDSLSLPLLGILPSVKENHPLLQDRGELDFQSFCTPVLQHINNYRRKSPLCIGILSVSPGEGKSVLAGNLAAAYGMRNESVLLVDTYIRFTEASPALKPFSSLFPQTLPPTSHCRITENRLQPRQEHSCFECYPRVAELIYPDLIHSSRGLEYLKQLRDLYSFTILEFPPIQTDQEVQAINSLVDLMVLVLQSNTIPITKAQRVVKTLRLTCKPLAGIVLNDGEWLDLQVWRQAKEIQ